MKILAAGLCALVFATIVPARTLHASASCGSVSMLALPNATITLAQAVEAGPFTPPDQANAAETSRALPAFCRVAATLKPTPDSDIKIEVWMPASGWNGKLQAVGNGAFNGSIAYPAMMTALARGYATSSSGGGEGPNTFDMIGALEQWVEHRKAPDHVTASHSTGGRVDRTRPLCPYPQVAVHNGTGSTDEAANFECRTR